jgi:pyridoxal phosphate enzyme (YggS family)
MADVQANLVAVRDQIEAVARPSGAETGVTLVAVSKGVPLEAIQLAWEAGQRVFGENRVQEGAEKARRLAAATWHFIGHLQTNKARQVSESFSLVQSLDSLRLARRLQIEGERVGRQIPVLLEVNVAGEGSKEGFGIDEALTVMGEILSLQFLSVQGLMTIAPLASDAEEVRPVFRVLRELRDEMRDAHDLPDLVHLSMGMSNDFEVAIEEGATMVRIGRAIFGERELASAELV